MVMSYLYRSPTTPGNPGWAVDLGNQAVRLGNIPGLITEAELGAVGQSSLMFDDPTGTAGHSGDAIVGLKQFSVNESACASGNRRIWEGYIGDRRYYRGATTSPSLRTLAARIIDMTLVDLNTFLSFRVFTPEVIDATSAFNRPAETDIERVNALLAVDFLSTTLFDNGLVSSTGGVDMDAVDYAGQRPADVLNDCAQQSGKNFFVYYDEPAGQFSLFYDFNASTVYPAYDTNLKISNVLADVNRTANVETGPIWSPSIDAVLVRDPSRVITGALWLNGSNSTYESLVSTSYTYGWRDAVVSSPNIKTPEQAISRLDRYLSENSTEDDRITFTVKFPRANVNDWKEGQWAPVKFSHLPGYEDYVNVRCLCRTVMQDEETDLFYNVKYEVTPMGPGEPQAAADFYQDGDAFSGIPILRTNTTPGNLLICVIVGMGPTSVYPVSPRFLDNPSLSVAPVPPYADAGGWTILAHRATDFGGMATGGPCSGYHPTTIPCTAGTAVAIAWRFVQPAEVTTHPVAGGWEDAHTAAGVWLWELPTTSAPGASTVADDAHASGTSATATLPTLSGNVLAAIDWIQVGYGHSPVASTTTTGTIVQSAGADNNPGMYTAPPANKVPWTQIIQLPTGGVVNGSITAEPGYGSGLNWCGVAVQLPAGIILPSIPFPGNQT